MAHRMVLALLATVALAQATVYHGGNGGLGGGYGGNGGGLGGNGGGYGGGLASPGYTAPLQVAIHAPAPEPYDYNPQYHFGYDVNDYHTGDSKLHTERRNGGIVEGRYEVSDPDGHRRIVSYIADPHGGFNARVSRIGPHGHTSN